MIINELLWWTGVAFWACSAALGAFILLMILADYIINLVIKRWFVVKEFWAFIQHRLDSKYHK